MQIAPLLQNGRGVTALIGGGGKTTLMNTLASELKSRGKVIICTSTKIKLPERYPTLFGASEDDVAAALAVHDVLCVAEKSVEDKLCAPKLPFETLSQLAPYVIVEADGARCLPLKAHASHEPVIPAVSQRVVTVIGIDGIGKRIAETCHRSAFYAQIAGVSENDVVTPEIAARVVNAEGWGDRVYINKVESAEAYDAATALAGYFTCPVVLGSLHKGVYECLH